MDRLDVKQELEFHPGSLGHPEWCSRPCIHFFRSGYCLQGSQCDYCHEPHEVRPLKMRRRLRTIFASLPREEQMFIILCYLSKLSAQLGFPAEATLLLQCLHLEWQQAQSAAQSQFIQLGITSRQLRSMHHAFSRMPLYAVVTHFPHSAPQTLHGLIEQVRWSVVSASVCQSPDSGVVYRVSL